MNLLSVEMKDQLAVITIQSPPANALSSALLMDLSQALDTIEQEANTKAIIIKGEGKFFSAGADIKEFTSYQSGSEHSNMAPNGQALFDRIETFQIPIIAAIHGAALGGGLELAMSCHMRIVAEDAQLGLPELTLGIIPGFGGTQRLPRHVGAAKAYEMILTAEPITGAEAASLGLANRAVPQEELEASALQLASKITAKSAPSIHSVMKVVPYTFTSQFGTGIEQEAVEFGKVFGTEDAKEGVQAFIEKRKPNFKDR
ncbi:enoyl-CoA hydratase [Pontibacillus halophilus JSM 076056 = DSM 19796]|uniref:Enoyl-CoA hydratase n=1 Tax=Pontibacillus halophilus JSM 076056 = DSM 19796 TaxID=1385510 RepID=A0A0A5GJK0_9BACI|nr:enoyl-CoA hydratase [Pontibacillus halophilus]KGX93426.1 enoyl-CoA hydratase [Pontibacillus halophilus JSM 076056 = DSM 19796]